MDDLNALYNIYIPVICAGENVWESATPSKGWSGHRSSGRRGAPLQQQ